MSYLCPVCNGFDTLQEDCPRCQTTMIDGGRLYDYYSDYSPYREIDDAKLDNGYSDLLHHHCLHACWCPACAAERTVIIEEWNTKKGAFPIRPS